MNKIKCHQCSHIQSAAHDICQECGAIMMRKPEFILADENRPIQKSIVNKPPPTDDNKPSSEHLDIGSVANNETDDIPEFEVICCFNCYKVQLVENQTCEKCNAIMDRADSYIFSSKKLENDILNLLWEQKQMFPKTSSSSNINIEYDKTIAENRLQASNNIQFQDSNTQYLSNQDIDSTVKLSPLIKKESLKPININQPNSDNQNNNIKLEQSEEPDQSKTFICCNKCYQVQEVKNTICNKCQALMDRDPVYIFTK